MTAGLVARGISKSFGGFKAVDAVDLTIEPGSRRAVIGPNGAGKTTLFNLLTGLMRPDTGAVSIADHDVTGVPPHRIASLGVTRAFQLTSIFSRLTVMRNVQVALMVSAGMTTRLWGASWSQKTAEARSILAEVGLEDLADVPAATTSHGDQRALELAIALAGNPRLLILDEPTAGMAPAETRTTMELIRRITRERGITLLFSEHDMDVVFDTADSITVMHQGRVLVEGTPDEVRGNAKVQEVYLGSV